MREIKFRTWNGKEIEYFTLDNNFDCVSGWLDGKILMQYTGLKDKNGFEIYEFDIVKYTNPYNKQQYTRQVKFCPMFACFGLYDKTENKYNYESDWLKIDDIEVIGNIYELNLDNLN